MEIKILDQHAETLGKAVGLSQGRIEHLLDHLHDHIMANLEMDYAARKEDEKAKITPLVHIEKIVAECNTIEELIFVFVNYQQIWTAASEDFMQDTILKKFGDKFPFVIIAH